MVTISLRTHLNHMDLKNWASSLFDRGRPLQTYGFKNRRATPTIEGETDSWTPDLIVWSNKMILIIECKGGDISQDDLTQAKDYINIPESLIMELTGLSRLVRKVVLLYFKSKFESNPELKEEILGKASLEKDLIIWTCEKGFSIALIDGSHEDDELDSLLKGGLALRHLPSEEIEIQPDSPIVLLENLVFTKLWERAFRFKDTRFTIGTAKEILESQNYAPRKRRERRLKDAIKSGESHGLCSVEQAGKVWKLDFILDSPSSIQRYLKKLTDILRYPELQAFYSTT